MSQSAHLESLKIVFKTVYSIVMINLPEYFNDE